MCVAGLSVADESLTFLTFAAALPLSDVLIHLSAAFLSLSTRAFIYD